MSDVPASTDSSETRVHTPATSPLSNAEDSNPQTESAQHANLIREHAIQLSTLSAPEKIALLDFERGSISSNDEFKADGMWCMICEEMTSSYHEHDELHCRNFRAYTNTLQELIATSSRSKASAQWSRKMCIVEYLSASLMPPVTQKWWHCACNYVMERSDITRLFTQHRLDQHPAPVQSNPLNRCVICLEQTRRIMFEPCHHVVCCASCSNNVDFCPICRNSIDNRVVVYMS
tara:strand:+ start:8590 stop:9288 length:699 start_codon:yes stop_codon:yes gene_type:complete